MVMSNEEFFNIGFLNLEEAIQKLEKKGFLVEENENIWKLHNNADNKVSVLLGILLYRKQIKDFLIIEDRLIKLTFEYAKNYVIDNSIQDETNANIYYFHIPLSDSGIADEVNLMRSISNYLEKLGYKVETINSEWPGFYKKFDFTSKKGK